MKKNKVAWKFGGKAGEGIMVTGLIFSKILSRGGYNVFDYVEYPSLIKGGHNNYYVRADANKVYSHLKPLDLLVALDKLTVDLHLDELRPGAGIIYDGEKVHLDKQNLKRQDVNLYPVPLLRLAEEAGGKIMRNTVALGASVALTDYDFNILANTLAEIFKRKGDKVINNNISAARAGYDHCKNNFEGFGVKLEKIQAPERILLTGNEAIGIGAIKAGCKFYAAYPMTPTSPILHFMAAQERKFNLVVKHAEDEIAVINMAIGAGAVGARAMLATSGGGFSLMTEALGLASISETPIVVVEGQRPGPATGMPTWTEQGDLQFILNAAQGEGPRIVMAPGDVEDCFYLTIDAFNLAEKYQMPVIIISDTHVAESHVNVERFKTDGVKIERGKFLSDQDLDKMGTYNRYQLTDDGISPRTLPPQKLGVHLANSYEHDEYGYASEDSEMRTKMVDKRAKKLELAQDEIPPPPLYGPSDADITLIGWGSTKGAIREAMEILKRDGLSANYLQVVYLNPFPSEKVSEVMSSAKKTMVVENNKTSQLSRLIAEKTLLKADYKLLKYDGRAFFPEEIIQKVREALRVREVL